MNKRASTVTALCLGCIAACASVVIPAAESHVFSPELTAAHALAPDYVARVLEAQRAASAEGDPAAYQDQLARIDLLTAAAVAEAERVRAVRQVDVLENRIAAALSERAQLEHARVELVSARARMAAGQVERAEATWVFSALLRTDAAAGKDRDRIWIFLLRRAQATAAVARALAADDAVLEAAALQLSAAENAKPAERITRARAASTAALAALGQARAKHERASAAERADLLERLRERGFSQAADDTQAAPEVTLSPIAGQASQLRRRVALLAELLPAFPHGPIELACAGSATEHGRLDNTCAYVEALAPADRARVHVTATTTVGATQPVRLALPAYALPLK